VALRTRWVVALIGIALVVTGIASGGWSGGLFVVGAAVALYVVWIDSSRRVE
jgi:hypothetical protein